MICLQETKDIEHLKLYIMGSEGCFACEDCRIALARVAQAMRMTAHRAKKAGYKSGKERRSS